MMKVAGKEPTRAIIRKFMEVRRKSGLSSNLQFSFDAEEAGFNAADLPAVTKIAEGVYEWEMSHGVLREDFGAYSYRSRD
ncbi:hypothetical protein Cp1R7AA1_109 [Mesorhizobium phage Cp1R7A-A1]|nr:hypothetical protein Cp1R7AA1_109 [Mesorhizobium phage Cp1R7A-A1]